MSAWYNNILTANTEDAFHVCWRESIRHDPDPNTTYEKWYEPLDRKIVRALKKLGVPESATEYFDDWCPNCTRHVTVERKFVSPLVVTAIHDLLKKDYEYWRIEIRIVGTIDDDDLTGSICVQKDWLLVWGDVADLTPRTDG